MGFSMEIINVVSKSKAYVVRRLNDELDTVVFTKQKDVYGNFVIHRNRENPERYDLRMTLGPDNLPKEQAGSIAYAFMNHVTEEMTIHREMNKQCINVPISCFHSPSLFVLFEALEKDDLLTCWRVSSSALRRMNDHAIPKVYSGLIH